MSRKKAGEVKLFTCGELLDFEKRGTHRKWVATVNALSKKLEASVPEELFKKAVDESRNNGRLEAISEMMDLCVKQAGSLFIEHKDKSAAQWRHAYNALAASRKQCMEGGHRWAMVSFWTEPKTVPDDEEAK